MSVAQLAPAEARDRSVRPRVIALIPAHNEESGIADTLGSLTRQTRPLDRIVVVADNCTDRTEEVARAAGAEVIATCGNTHKKAGALNQALDQLLPGCSDSDAILVMDADTTVDPRFIELGAQTLQDDARAGGVSSVFTGRPATTVLGEFQRMEYHRYRREITRYANQAFVMSGTASIFRVAALRHVREARDGQRLPLGDSYYDVDSLTEDNELTFALKTLDYSCPAPGATSVTDVMETVPALYHQRHRWYLGALRNLKNYGLKLPWHLRWMYWRQQVGLCLSVATLALILLSLVLGLVVHREWAFAPIWLIPTVILLTERVVTVWGMGARQRWLAALLVPELAYSLLLVFTFAAAAVGFVRGSTGRWHAT